LSFKDKDGADQAWSLIDLIGKKEDDKPNTSAIEIIELLNKPWFSNLWSINERLKNSVFQVSKRSRIIQQVLADSVFFSYFSLVAK